MRPVKDGEGDEDSDEDDGEDGDEDGEEEDEEEEEDEDEEEGSEEDDLAGKRLPCCYALTLTTTMHAMYTTHHAHYNHFLFTIVSPRPLLTTNGLDSESEGERYSRNRGMFLFVVHLTISRVFCFRAAPASTPSPLKHSTTVPKSSASQIPVGTSRIPLNARSASVPRLSTTQVPMDPHSKGLSDNGK